jgi:radical SAM superfamily enzyme YgiQ (UPF0313 family)
MKIMLLDLVHNTIGMHIKTVPLGCGLIATYLKKNIDYPLDIKLFKEPLRVLETLKEWIPDVVGLAQYCWNSELNLYVAKRIKEINPNCIIIAGGPNLLPEESYIIDFFLFYDGEIHFKEIIEKIISGEPLFRKITTPFFPLHIPNLDVFGSVYETGIFDEFLEHGYHPFVQTHRGCPFSCIFCHTSDPYYSEILFQSPEIFRRDLEYIAKKCSDKTLYVANTNMSLFEQDFEIAKIIKETQEKYNFPLEININTGKNTKNLLRMISFLPEIQASLPLQTLTPKVLKNIKRKNISLEVFTDFQKKVKLTSTELIIGLPGETKETFIETLRKVVNTGVRDMAIYTLMLLKNTPLEHLLEEYEYVVKHRIVPMQFSEIDGTKIFDTEEVLVANKDMSFDDYLELRGLAFTVQCHYCTREPTSFDEVLKVHSRIKETELFKAFMRETEEELFDSREELILFYEEHYQDLLDGKRGLNLMSKYRKLYLEVN